MPAWFVLTYSISTTFKFSCWHIKWYVIIIIHRKCKSENFVFSFNTKLDGDLGILIIFIQTGYLFGDVRFDSLSVIGFDLLDCTFFLVEREVPNKAPCDYNDYNYSNNYSNDSAAGQTFLDTTRSFFIRLVVTATFRTGIDCKRTLGATLCACFALSTI